MELEHAERRPRGRPRKNPLPSDGAAPVEAAPSERKVRMGPRACMTSKGVSGPGRHLRHGILIDLPADEADNLVNLGYATYA
jgi:hypothetical protein